MRKVHIDFESRSKTEIWDTVQGHNGQYKISNMGRVMCVGTDKILSVCNTNYSRVRLYHARPSKSYLVHRLVALAFLPRVSGKPEVNHKNFDRFDNRAENLEWSTRQQNVDHAFHRMPKGEKVHFSKLTAGEVKSIRHRRGRGAPLNKLAFEYGVTFSNISAIALRKSWRHV